MPSAEDSLERVGRELIYRDKQVVWGTRAVFGPFPDMPAPSGGAAGRRHPYLGGLAARKDEQVVRKDRLTDGRDEVFPTFVVATSQTQHSLQKGDRSFDAGTETLSNAE